MPRSEGLSVMQRALGDNWQRLEGIVQRHYEMAPGCSSEMTITGVMDEVFHSYIAKLFLLPARIFGALVPYRGKAIQTVVRNWTTADDPYAMFWHRTLRFPGRPPVEFRSRMEYWHGDEIIEYVRYGLGIRMRMSVEDGALVFKSSAYVWRFAGLPLNIPAWALLGDAKIVERALSDKAFYICFEIVHPLFGRTFGYSGTFSIGSYSHPRYDD